LTAAGVTLYNPHIDSMQAMRALDDLEFDCFPRAQCPKARTHDIVIADEHLPSIPLAADQTVPLVLVEPLDGAPYPHLCPLMRPEAGTSPPARFA
jgi:hypothetical protein